MRYQAHHTRFPAVTASRLAIVWIAALLAALIVSLAQGPASAGAAKQSKLTGKVKGGGAARAALLLNTGQSVQQKLKGGKFSFPFSKRSGKGAMLVLTDSHGRVSQTIVLGRKSKKAGYAALSGRAGDLGTFTVRKGYAIGNAKPELVSKRGTVIMKGGKPVGQAKNFGFVNAKRVGNRSQQFQQPAPGGDGPPPDGPPPGGDGPPPGGGDTGFETSSLDPDQDGVPSQVDPSDDGDKVPDMVQGDGLGAILKGNDAYTNIFSNFKVDISESVNWNQGNATSAAIDAMWQKWATLVFAIGQNGFSAVDIDAGGHPLTGSGTQFGVGGSSCYPPGVAEGDPLLSYDPDGDGNFDLYHYDPMTHTCGGNGVWELIAKTHLTTSQLTAADMFTFQATPSAGGPDTLYSQAAGTLFETNPSLKQYDTGSGAQSVNYGGALQGTIDNPIALPSGTILMEIYRPQVVIPGQPVLDLGGLDWGVEAIANHQVMRCDASRYSNLGSTLTTGGDPMAGAPFTDTAATGPINSASPIQFQVDVKGCFQDNGVATPVTDGRIDIQARAANGANTVQAISVTVP